MTPFKIVLLFSMLAVPAIFLLSGCDDESSSEASWVHTSIRQPADGAVIRDSTLRILADVTRNCGCQARAEFWIDGRHVFTDFLADYSYDWDLRGVSGPHTILVRGVVEGKAEESDSVRVTINP